MVKVVISLSLSGSLLIFFLLLCKPLLKDRVSKQWQYYIWLIVIARLLLPFSTKESLMGTLFERAGQNGISAEIAAEADAGGAATTEAASDMTDIDDGGVSVEAAEAERMDFGAAGAERMDSGAESADFGTVGTEGVDSGAAGAENAEISGRAAAVNGQNTSRIFASAGTAIWKVLWFGWLGTALVLLTWKIAGYQNFIRYIGTDRREVSDVKLLDLMAEVKDQMGIKRCVELYTCSLVSSPLLLGFFRPCIVLPDTDLSEKDFRYTVRHELVHCRRLDILYKWLVQIAICLHWFNPLVRMMGKEVSRSCELACDEAVIRDLEEEERIVYGDMLLRAIGDGSSRKNPLAVLTLSEGGKLMKERLKAIMGFQRKPKLVTALSVLLAGVLMFGAVMTGTAAYGGSSEELTVAEYAGMTGSEKGSLYMEEDDILQKKPAGSSAAMSDDAPDGEVIWETLDLKGTTYYLVFDEAQLRAIGSGDAGLDKNYMQQADIQMSSEDWIPIGTMEHPFTGSYNGNGYEIRGLTMTDPDAELTGLFGAAKDAHIYNIILRDCDMIEGGLAGEPKENSDFGEVLGLDLGGVRFYNCIVYAKNKPEDGAEKSGYAIFPPDEEEDGGDAEKYYEAGNLPQFGYAFFLLGEKEQRKWMEKFYDEGETAFFSVSAEQLDKDSLLIGEFAEKAYEDGAVSFFSVLAENHMSEEQLEAWLERAVSDERTGFQSVLYGALDRDWEQEALEEELDRQRLEEYEKYGLSTAGKLHYYLGQPVNIFLDHVPGSRSYFLSTNPAGTVNVKVLRDANGTITGMDYMTKEEVNRFFGDL